MCPPTILEAASDEVPWNRKTTAFACSGILEMPSTQEFSVDIPTTSRGTLHQRLPAFRTFRRRGMPFLQAPHVTRPRVERVRLDVSHPALKSLDLILGKTNLRETADIGGEPPS